MMQSGWPREEASLERSGPLVYREHYSIWLDILRIFRLMTVTYTEGHTDRLAARTQAVGVELGVSPGVVCSHRREG
jgi:hypothetical protein